MWNYVGTGKQTIKATYVNYCPLVTPTSSSVPCRPMGCRNVDGPAPVISGSLVVRTNIRYLDDLWHYNISTSTWSKVPGCKPSGVMARKEWLRKQFPLVDDGEPAESSMHLAHYGCLADMVTIRRAQLACERIYGKYAGAMDVCERRQIVNQNGVYGTQGTLASQCSRWTQASVSWTDASGKFLALWRNIPLSWRTTECVQRPCGNLSGNGMGERTS